MKTILNIIASALAISFATAAFAQVGNFRIEKNDFKELYNDYRYKDLKDTEHGTPWAGTYWPHGEAGLAWEWDPAHEAPTVKYDNFWNQGTRATDWEKEHHSCESYRGTDYYEGCKGWWGHCNAWAAAAIIEDEPRSEKQIEGEYFNVGDKKGFLTELWMSSNSLFAGNTNKSIETASWVCDPNDAKSKAKSRGVTNYDSFWDLNPRDTLFIVTNSLGINGKGVVIDRFTGDQVWNQPLVAYRMKNVEDAGKIEQNGVTLYKARLDLEIYWAEDGVSPDIDTAVFDFDRLDDESFSVRKLGMTLFFDAPVKVSREGNVTAAGNIVGKGIWDHQEDCSSWNADSGHPDFIWQPSNLVRSDGRGSNPYIQAERVYNIIKNHPKEDGTPSVEPGDSDDDEVVNPKPDENEDLAAAKEWTLTFTPDSFRRRSSNPKYYVRAVRALFIRSSQPRFAHINYRDVKVTGKKIVVPVHFSRALSVEGIKVAAEESGATLLKVKKEQ